MPVEPSARRTVSSRTDTHGFSYTRLLSRVSTRLSVLRHPSKTSFGRAHIGTCVCNGRTADPVVVLGYEWLCLERVARVPCARLTNYGHAQCFPPEGLTLTSGQYRG